MMWTVWKFTWITQTEDGRDLWSRLRGFFDQCFVERLDKVIEEDSTTFLQALIG